MKILLLLLFGIVSHAQAQTAILSAGSESFSIGQTVYIAYSKDAYSIEEGIQKSYQGIEIIKDSINSELSVYPNPTTDILSIEMKNSNNGKLLFKLYNLEGRLVKTNIVNQSITTISMKNLASESYMLQIIDSEKIIKTFKILKI